MRFCGLVLTEKYCGGGGGVKKWLC
jgi:hypothetical protein